MMHDTHPTDDDRQTAKTLRNKKDSGGNMTGPEWVALHRLEQWIEQTDNPKPQTHETFKYVGK